MLSLGAVRQKLQVADDVAMQFLELDARLFSGDVN